jgi:(p)ppGpp synthase/HD superfamily hydrolase
MSMLEQAIALAATAHRSQFDRVGQPYILHPLRVMLKQTDEEARIAAVLHDVVEDTSITLADLRAAGYSEAVCTAVDCLTRRAGESYDEMVTRISANPLACRVKLADLEDNMDPSRHRSDDPQTQERMARYRKARERLVAL